MQFRNVYALHSRIDLPDVTRPIGLLLPWKINGISTADERAINKPMVTLLIFMTLNSNIGYVNDDDLNETDFRFFFVVVYKYQSIFLMIFFLDFDLLNLKTIESNLCVKVSLFSAHFRCFLSTYFSHYF